MGVFRFKPKTLPIRLRPGYCAARLAIDALAIALVEHGHAWTMRERELYEAAVKQTDPHRNAA